MKCESKPFTQIDREYRITSKELKDKLGIEGEILNMNLFSGRSPHDESIGKSADFDIWEIQTKEVIKK